MDGQKAAVLGKRALLEKSGVRNLEQLNAARANFNEGGTHRRSGWPSRVKPAGLLALSDPIKSSTPEAIKNLHRSGSKVIMLTGDNRETARQVAGKLKIDDVRCGDQSGG